MRVDEIFYSLQGEGTRRGRPCAFVRLTGCPLRCVWCDTAYAFHGGTEMGVEEVLAALRPHPTRLVCVTGGEPLLQEQVHELMAALLAEGWTVLLETSGALDASGVDRRVVRILDLKAPGSGEAGANDWSNLERLEPGKDELKFVLADREDYEWAVRQLRERELDRFTVHFSPVHGELDRRALAEWILEDGLDVRLNLQLHKFVWDPETKRV